MMQEVSDESVVPTTAIADQLQDAAQTNVTQASPGAFGTTTTPSPAPLPGSPQVSNIAPPSQLPPNLSSPPPMTQLPPNITSPPSQLPANISSPPSQLPPNLTSPIGGTLMPGGMQSPTGGFVPPPTGGFVPTPGAITGTPSKYAGSIASPSSPVLPPTTASYNPSQGAPLSSPQPLPPTQTSFTGPPQSQTQIGYPAAPSAQYTHQMSPPGSMSSPHEVSASIDLGGEPSGPVYQTQEENKQGLFGWFSGSSFMNKVVEKTKTLSENVITTLDPGMKEVIYSDGGLDLVVASQTEVKVSAVRQAFQEVFGRANVLGQASQPPGIAPQPVGYTAGLKGCEERIEQLRRSGQVDHRHVMVAVENFIVEVLPDRWFDIGCILLKDSVNHIELQTFTQATPVPSDYVQQAQDQTPNTYDLRWSGLALTVGQIINRNLPYVSPSDWHAHFTGVSRRELIYLGAKMIAGMYRQKLPAQALGGQQHYH